MKNATQACVVTNTLNATGGLAITKTTREGIGGPFTFVIVREGNTTQKTVSATTTSTGTAVPATGDDLSKLQPGNFAIIEYPPVIDGAAWVPTTITCANATPPAVGQGFGVTIVAGQTTQCAFTNTRSTRGTLIVNKHVINDNGGTATAGDWSIHVKRGDNEVTGSPQAGSESGTPYTLEGGTYTVSETGGPSGSDRASAAIATRRAT